VAYSKESTTGQHKIKSALITHLNAALAPLADSSYRIRDTGDGAVVAFLNNPEHPLYAALALWQACTAEGEAAALPFKRLRLGLHTGVVKEVPDVEGRPNYVGDGINSAKRVQDLAEPGQMLASRNFFDAMSHLDADYLRLFEPAGAGDDKHGRSHELYAVHFEQAAFDRLAQETQQEQAHTARANGATNTALPVATAAPKAARPGVKPVVWLGLAAVFGLLMLVWFLSISSHTPATVKERPMPEPVTLKERPMPEPVTLPAVSSATAAIPAFVPVSQPASSASVSASVPEPKPTPTPAQPVTIRIQPAPPVSVKAQISSAPKVPVVQERPKVSHFSVRCSRLLEKVSMGEPLSSSEQQEMVSKCQ